jgi:hypothetical protein
MVLALLLVQSFAQHYQATCARAPAGFTCLAAPPFVVLGDEPPEQVRARAQTVAWAVSRLRTDFFARDPDPGIDIWLLRDAESYRKWARARFGDDPDTPYGYYSAAHHALVMNIATGGGTLVHEIVHPYLDANFPERPAWLNEGLGSLYEQSAERNGHIVGLPNWRLPGLQRAIRAHRLPALAWLLAQSERDFYERDPGTNYAQARYLLYYLQERGLLREYLARVMAGRTGDPTGIATLRELLPARDLGAFQAQFCEFVLALHFPG